MPKQLSHIPLNETGLTGQESGYLDQVLRSGVLAGPGSFSDKCASIIAADCRAPASLIVPSCTAALEMAMILLDLKAGDEVILPSFTFVSTANAVALRGATPVFVDVDPITFCIDPQRCASAVTTRTRAIVPVHYAGVPSPMSALEEIAKVHDLALVEDAAQAYGASIDGSPVGSIGRFGCFSFHGTKNIIAGEAGALVLRDEDDVGRAHVLQEKGTNRLAFLNGEIDRYNWVALGSSNIVSELTAAVLRAQLEDAQAINKSRREFWDLYMTAFADLALEGHFEIPAPPSNVTHNAHIFFLVLPSEEKRRALQSYLSECGISALTHYVPLHDAPAGKAYGRVHGPMLQTQRAAKCLIRLPLFSDLGSRQDRVIEAVRKWAATKQE